MYPGCLGQDLLQDMLPESTPSASYVLTLTSAAYPGPGGEPKTFRDAVDHWLLCKILSAIGSHSMM